MCVYDFETKWLGVTFDIYVFISYICVSRVSGFMVLLRRQNDMTLNNLRRLICTKTQPTNQP